MKIAIFFLFLVSSYCHSWTCPEEQIEQDAKSHWDYASDVMFAQVLSGEHENKKGSSYDFKYKIDILHSFKGKYNGVIKLKQQTGSASEPLTLSGFYIIFSQGKEIDFCSLVLPIPHYINSYSKLVEFSESEGRINKLVKKIIGWSSVNLNRVKASI